MKRKHAAATADLARDPFRENGARTFSWRARVLGAPCEFSSNSRALLAIAREAFAQTPLHRWPGDAARSLRIGLRLVKNGARAQSAPPRAPMLSSGAGMFCGHVDAHTFLVVIPDARRALLQVDESMLRHRRLVRYELFEFAAIQLATRVQGLVSLHAGCVGARGRGVLLLGSSGTGKSTLGLHAALAGLDFLAEDSVFVHPAALLATGFGAFAHARADSLRLIGDRSVRQAVRAAPSIERRSGVRKHEIDLRRGLARLAPKPLRIVATVVLSGRAADSAEPFAPLSAVQLQRELRAGQAYAIGQPGWREFEARLLAAGGFRLHRVPPPEAVACLRQLLAGGAS